MDDRDCGCYFRLLSSEVIINFLGFSDADADYEKAHVVVLPVPYEATVSYGRGTAKGPDAILDASAQVELYDEELGSQFASSGVATLPALDVAGRKPEELSAIITPAVKKILDDGKWPLVLGGEHSITPHVVKAIHDIENDFTVVQFDAHADLRQEYEGEPMSHACALARAREYCKAVQVGIRNVSPEGAAAIEREGYPIFYSRDMRSGDGWMEKALSSIESEKIYITMDLDAFDGNIMPATGTPEPGGMDWWQVTGFMKMLFQNKKVMGMDIVELAPIPGFHACDFLAAKLGFKAISYLKAF